MNWLQRTILTEFLLFTFLFIYYSNYSNTLLLLKVQHRKLLFPCKILSKTCQGSTPVQAFLSVHAMPNQACSSTQFTSGAHGPQSYVCASCRSKSARRLKCLPCCEALYMSFALPSLVILAWTLCSKTKMLKFIFKPCVHHIYYQVTVMQHAVSLNVSAKTSTCNITYIINHANS